MAQRAVESGLRLKAFRHDCTWCCGHYSRCREAKEWTHEQFDAFAGDFDGMHSVCISLDSVIARTPSSAPVLASIACASPAPGHAGGDGEGTDQRAFQIYLRVVVKNTMHSRIKRNIPPKIPIATTTYIGVPTCFGVDVSIPQVPLLRQFHELHLWIHYWSKNPAKPEHGTHSLSAVQVAPKSFSAMHCFVLESQYKPTTQLPLLKRKRPGHGHR